MARGDRDPLDRYYTPANVAEWVVGWLRVPPHWTIIEPSVGRHVWPDALRRAGHTGRIIGVDVDEDARQYAAALDVEFIHGDWPTVAPTVRADLVIGNPPFAPAVPHLRAGLASSPRVVFVLRGSFVEPAGERDELWRTLQPTWEVTIGDRVNFEPHPSVIEARLAAGKPKFSGDSMLHSVFRFDAGRTVRGWRRQCVRIGESPTWERR